MNFSTPNCSDSQNAMESSSTIPPTSECIQITWQNKWYHKQLCLTKTYLHQKSYCHTIYLVEAGGGYVTLNLDILFREKACTELKFARQSEKYKNEIKLLLITWFAWDFKVDASVM